MTRTFALLTLCLSAYAQSAAAQESPEITIITGRDGAHATTYMAMVMNADADTVWKIVGDWDLSEMPSAFFKDVKISGRDVGDLRTITFKDEYNAPPVVERLESLDPIARVYTYSLIDSGGLPWADYSGKLSVQGYGPDQSIVLYESRMIPVGQNHAEASSLSVENNSAWFIDVANRFADDADE